MNSLIMLENIESIARLRLALNLEQHDKREIGNEENQCP
jgi:hypothetical protein